MRPLRGCSGITRLACTQPWATSAPSSLNSSGIEQRKQAMEKQESKIRFPTFPQPLRLRTITSYGIRILRARSSFVEFIGRGDGNLEGRFHRGTTQSLKLSNTGIDLIQLHVAH